MPDGVLRFVATDGHVLATADVRAPHSAHNIRPVILSRTFVADVLKATRKGQHAFKHVRLAIGSTRASLTDWEGNVIEGGLIDGTFPDYERVIPRGDSALGTATLGREAFMQAVAAVTAFGQVSGERWPDGPALRFAFTPEKLSVSAAMEGSGSACRGSASVVVDVAASTMPAPREIGFRGSQVLDILKSLQGRQVRFDLFDMTGPNNFVGDRADGSALHVIMPVKL
jgi:DNA polymerase-3 subunit beta